MRDERILHTLLYALLLGALAGALMGCLSPTAQDVWEVSPGDLFRFDPGDFGPPVQNSGVIAEERWRAVEGCTGLSFTPRLFVITLRKAQGECDNTVNGLCVSQPYFDSGGLRVGGRYHPRRSIEVFGDPKWVQSWKHEMLHYLFDLTTGNSDANHGRDEWLRCTTT